MSRRKKKKGAGAGAGAALATRQFSVPGLSSSSSGVSSDAELCDMLADSKHPITVMVQDYCDRLITLLQQCYVPTSDLDAVDTDDYFNPLVGMRKILADAKSYGADELKSTVSRVQGTLEQAEEIARHAAVCNHLFGLKVAQLYNTGKLGQGSEYFRGSAFHRNLENYYTNQLYGKDAQHHEPVHLPFSTDAYRKAYLHIVKAYRGNFSEYQLMRLKFGPWKAESMQAKLLKVHELYHHRLLDFLKTIVGEVTSNPRLV